MKGDLHHEVPFARLSSDICGPFELKMEGVLQKVFFVVFIDLCSRWVEIVSTTSITSKRIAKLFEQYLLRKHPKPKIVLTDQGRQYLGKEFRTVCELNKIKHMMNTS